MSGLGIQIIEPAEELGPQPGALQGVPSSMIDAIRSGLMAEQYRRSFYFALGGAVLGSGIGYAVSSKKHKVRGSAFGALGVGLGVGAIRFFLGLREVSAAVALLEAGGAVPNQ